MRLSHSVALFSLLILVSFSACKTSKTGAASGEPVIDIAEVSRIEKTLSADDMAGRKIFTPGIDKAAAFIASEFEKAGLEQLANGQGYLQKFSMLKPSQVSASAVVDGRELASGDFIVITGQPALAVTEQSGYEIAGINKGDNLFQKANEYAGSGKNLVVLVDTSFSKNFPRLSFFKRQMMETANSTVFILGQNRPSTYKIEATHTIEKLSLSNVVGVIPGKSRKNEFVIFSGHYDHLGIGKPLNGDSIYNGANDDAAGTTAVIMLARYFKQLNNNERTIIFAAFTAEESGGYGATYFSRQFDPAKVMAMFNIEMIGTESKWGTNSAYITGYEKTNMGEILAKNLQGSGFTFHPDPYPDQQLFYRSDNATLARLGVPAHTISTSKMDSEKYYHTADDEFETLDMENMTRIIRAIAISSKTIVAGQDTPTRVNTAELR